MKHGVAWLVPGQGEDLRAFADLPEMAQPARTPGGDACAALAARLFELVGESLRFDVARALREAHPRLLDTDVAQPVAVALSLALGAARAARDPAPIAVAGLSLGELAAVACAGALAPEDAVRAAVVRGELMAEAARAIPGGMLALPAIDENDVQGALAVGRAAGAIVIAGRVSPTQWTLSGDHQALRAVLATRPGTLLRVQGAWHSPAMASVVAPWETFLRRLPWKPPVHPLALAGRATFAACSEDLVTSLCAQLTGPTQWFATLQLLHARGVNDVEVLGPPRILRALWRESVAAVAKTSTTSTTTPTTTSTTSTTEPAAQAPDTAPEQDAAWLAAHALEPLALGAIEVSALLPQRPPLLLVDRVWARGVVGRAQPALLAALAIHGRESVLRGHFPGHPVWPGVYTLEGLAQACILAGALASDRRAGADLDHRREPPARADATPPDAAPADAAPADAAPASGFAVIAAVKVKLLRLVTPPACLVYFVEKVAEVGGLHRFDVRASVDGRDVAAGTLDVAFQREDVRAEGSA